jgi:hypothetical protein
MKSICLLIVTLVLILPQNILGEKPVLAIDYSIDTSLYTGDHLLLLYTVPGPLITDQIISGSHGNTMLAWVFRKKNSNQYDIYSFEGKCGTSTIPETSYPDDGASGILSQTMIDDDVGWESIVNYHWYKDNIACNKFKVFDDNGTELLSDSGNGAYGFDGKNTYIVSCTDYHIKSWRFRTNIMNTSSSSLAKTKAVQSSPMQIYGLSGGDYRVTLSPSNGNQLSFQMFDLMGRCVLSKQINNLTSPVSFIIPENNVPKSPFIAKVNDGNQSFYKKQIPVR